ncbi:MAG: phosphotransferase [Alphaproteobacteria bacterium]|nr:phosphotransferase [Alphaproteobacteria bacterium]
MNNFLKAQGWRVVGPVGEDMASRRYVRVQKQGRTAVLMENYGETPGHSPADFIRIGNWLRSVGVRAPEIYEVNEGAGLILLEDFGDLSFKKALNQGADPKKLYLKAVEILTRLQKQNCPLDLPLYHESHVHKRHRRVIDWYLPATRQHQNSDGVAEAYLAAWNDIEKNLPASPHGFLHIDYHAENLMCLPDGEIGVLDFQGAMRGPVAYDLGNLLEDPRCEIPPALRAELLEDKDESFKAHYRVLTTQFHCRVIGQFIQLAVRQDKPRYLAFVPVTARYLHEALKDPLLSPLRRFFDDLSLDFSAQKDLNAAFLQGLDVFKEAA